MFWFVEMALRATQVDYLKKENACEHHTSEFDNPHLIVRRGQTFKLKITFNREVTRRDKVILQFTTGTKTALTTFRNTIFIVVHKIWIGLCSHLNSVVLFIEQINRIEAVTDPLNDEHQQWRLVCWLIIGSVILVGKIALHAVLLFSMTNWSSNTDVNRVLEI